ncbi:hypothetical protein [Sphingomonas sp. 35-24ZXX]|uniref:hypothetical protein n=1 Tax=Sphingomonas sp. 35-24ZXX TaxID=1545915 RepID=UPI00053C06BA|nr:hypothetical protein [Sphingomonas sp. 35-24ZXX]
MRTVFGLLAALILNGVTVSTPLMAQERSAVRQGFVLPAQSGKTILVLRPSVRVAEQSTGGLPEPRAEWTDQARRNIDAALVELQRQLGNTVIAAPETYGEDARRVAEHLALFGAVSEAVIQYQFFVGNRLPTKKRDNKAGQFDWSLGSDVAKLPGADEADYALFIVTNDHYGSTGRKMLQIVGLVAGVGVTSGLHAGYAGLVDLKTGHLLWLNADGQMGGDVRDPEGAMKRVRQLLEDFPGSAIAKDPPPPETASGTKP